MTTDAFARLAERQIAGPRQRILSAAEKRVARRAEKALAQQAEQLATWRRESRQREQALLEGEYVDSAQQLVGLLGHLTPEDAVALIECAEKFRAADADTRATVLALANDAITAMRQSHGWPPIDDPLPGQPASVFLTLREMLS
jgi:hypothetical protein